MSKHKEVKMVKEYEPGEVTKILDKGKLKADKLWDEIDGKQTSDILPEELAPVVFVLLEQLLSDETVLDTFRSKIQDLAAICAYAGMRYEQQRR